MVRAVAAQLHAIAVLLQDIDAPARGIAPVEWLITASGSPLYGTDVGRLREGLARARYFLTARR